MKKDVCLFIPAKLSSSRIPNKNWREFYKGKSLVDITRGHAKEIKSVLKGASIFLSSDHNRPYCLCNKTATMKEVLTYHIKKGDITEDIVCVLQPTSPFRNIKQVIKNIKLIKRENFISGIFPVKVEKLKLWHFKWPYPAFWFSNNSHRNSQDIERYHIECGNFLIFRTKNVPLYYWGGYPQPAIIKYPYYIDIDTPEDWKYAQYLYKKRRIICQG